MTANQDKRDSKEAPRVTESKTAGQYRPPTRSKPAQKEPVVREEVSVSAGAIDRVIDLAFNPTRDKIREVTIVDRMQGRMFPQLDMISLGRRYCLEIALCRQDEKEYERLFGQERPISPDLIDEFLFRTAQWQKSVAGKNLERATDIALAETEVRAGEEDGTEGRDAWGKE